MALEPEDTLTTYLLGEDGVAVMFTNLRTVGGTPLSKQQDRILEALIGYQDGRCKADKPLIKNRVGEITSFLKQLFPNFSSCSIPPTKPYLSGVKNWDFSPSFLFHKGTFKFFDQIIIQGCRLFGERKTDWTYFSKFDKEKFTLVDQSTLGGDLYCYPKEYFKVFKFGSFGDVTEGTFFRIVVTIRQPDFTTKDVVLNNYFVVRNEGSILDKFNKVLEHLEKNLSNQLEEEKDNLCGDSFEDENPAKRPKFAKSEDSSQSNDNYCHWEDYLNLDNE